MSLVLYNLIHITTLWFPDSFMSPLFSERSPLLGRFFKSLFLLGFHIIGYYKPALIMSEPGTRPLGTASMYQSLKANSKPIYPCPLLPEENKVLSIVSPFPSAYWPTQALSQAHGLLFPFILGTVTNYFSNGNHFPIFWPYKTSHFPLIHYILKHSCWEMVRYL